MPRTLVVLLALATLVCALPAAAQSATTRDAAVSDSTSAPLMLWSLSDADNTVYLLGSIHFARPDLFPLAAPIEAAYDSADVVVFEIDLADMQAQAMALAQRGMFPDTTTLADVLPDSLYDRAVSVTAPFGLPEAAVSKMEPWMLSLTLSSLELMTSGYANGIDQHYYERAVADEKTVRALETVAFQIDLFDTMPMTTQTSFLRYTLDEAGSMATMLDGMTTAWAEGDTAALDAFMNDGFVDFPEVKQRLLGDRNAAWVPQIEALLDGADDAFVVVGAGHLVGDESVVALLEAKGHRVPQRWSSPR
ncbi:MAG: TraB/GumN family protein [Bacteroidota bacterium]